MAGDARRWSSGGVSADLHWKVLADGWQKGIGLREGERRPKLRTQQVGCRYSAPDIHVISHKHLHNQLMQGAAGR